MKKYLSIQYNLNDKLDLIYDVEKKFDIKFDIIDDDIYNIRLILNKKYYHDNKFDNHKLSTILNNKLKSIESYVKNNYNVNIFYDIFNKNNVEFHINDPLNDKIIYNLELLKTIFKNNIEIIKDHYDELNDDIIIEIINDNIDKFNNLSFYDLLKLFNEINNNLISIHEINYKLFYVLKLFEFVIDDLKKFIHDKYINSSFKINIDHMNLLYNKHLSIDSNFYYNEIIDDIYYYELKENIDDELIDLYDIDIIDDKFNEYKFYNELYFDNLSNEFNINIHYENNDDEFIILNIDELFKILYEIDDHNNTNYKYYDLFDIESIDKIFEYFNNNLSFDEFVYLFLENEFELIYDDEYYYNIYYVDKFKNKYYDIYDVKKGILNYLKHLNLNNSFEFNDELYDII